MENQGELFSEFKSIDKSKGTKICIKCEEEKSSEDFVLLYSMSVAGKPQYSRVCLRCEAIRKRQVRSLRATSSYPPEGYVCPICLKTPEEIIPQTNGTTTPFVLDHNHDTGNFKGWICGKCNSALGFFEDNTNHVRRALKYLEECEESC
tara:strand:- start:60 stop:506 length:447 start_codon:yes stop_codon:yes gene_type:complete